MFLILWLMPIAFYALTWWTTGWSLSPDGAFYCSMGRGERVPRPYAQRWLLPAVLGDRPTLWRVWGALAVVLSAVLVGEYAGTSFQTKLIAELLFMGLPGLWRLNVRLPVLVDPTALCCALGAALLDRSGHHGLAAALVILGTCVKETTFLFAAIFAGTGFFLLGAFVLLLSRVCRPYRPNPAEPWLRNPAQEARKAHDFLNPVEKIVPWGAVALLFFLGGFRDMTPLTWVAVGLAYAQCLVAQDNARLFQWSAPMLIAVVLKHPPAWVGVAAVLGLFNPYRGT